MFTDLLCSNRVLISRQNTASSQHFQASFLFCPIYPLSSSLQSPTFCFHVTKRLLVPTLYFPFQCTYWHRLSVSACVPLGIAWSVGGGEGRGHGLRYRREGFERVGQELSVMFLLVGQFGSCLADYCHLVSVLCVSLLCQSHGPTHILDKS